MKIMMTNDLHGSIANYRWVLAHAREWDLIVIAGDLFDGFAKGGLWPQFCAFHTWLNQLQLTGVPLAFCSGNHDTFHPSEESLEGLDLIQKELLSRLLLNDYWANAFAQANVYVDGTTHLLSIGKEQILITALPYDAGDGNGSSAISRVWSESIIQRRQHPKADWLVLHHEPPADTSVGGMNGNEWIANRITEASPSYLLSGHIHNQPYFPHGSWLDRMRRTWCFNPGQPPKKPSWIAPNHIILDTQAQSATWCYWNPKEKKEKSETRSLAKNQS